MQEVLIQKEQLTTSRNQKSISSQYAKQFTGLEDCMVRDEQKLHTHFDIAMTVVVSVTKAAYYLSIPKEQGEVSQGQILK